MENDITCQLLKLALVPYRYPKTYRLEAQINYLLEHPQCMMVSSLVRVITEDGQEIRIDKFQSEHLYYNLIFTYWVYHPTVMYRKQAVEDVGMYTALYSEDMELFWQLTRKYLLHNRNEVLLDHRVTNQSLRQVLKKSEYEFAQQEQVLRNIRYYTGNDCTVPISFTRMLPPQFRTMDGRR
ncbi:hypothetical protein POKO110462_22845 [Pontibacter korlensis]|nr:hypothetical protein [Pontibacter korlensis]